MFLNLTFSSPQDPIMAEQDKSRAEDDKFERDLQEMLEDGPNLNDVTANVQGGTPNSVSSAFADNVEPFSAGASSGGAGSAQSGSGGIYGPSSAGSSRLTRSFTVPPGVLFTLLTFSYCFSLKF